MSDINKPKDTREIAARALCEFEDLPEDAIFDGKPMWMSYLEQVDVVLQAIGWKPDIDAQATEK